jgi:hypothetical protein
MSFLLNFPNITHQYYKVFCIGRNKTGTTSMARAVVSLGFKLGKQSRAERLLEDWGKRDFCRIIRYCKSADAFQDIPFSLRFFRTYTVENSPSSLSVQQCSKVDKYQSNKNSKPCCTSFTSRSC